MNDSSREPPLDVDVSVVIPVDDLSNSDLGNCLRSLREQDYDGGYEVIVVEGGNIPQARNEGLRRAGGRYLAFVDSDCTVPRDWLRKMVTSLRTTGVAGVGGAGVSPKNSSLFSEAVDLAYQSYIGSLGSPSLCKTDKVVPAKALSTSNSIYRHEVVRRVGGFDERYLLNEDTDLSVRVRAFGYPLYFTPDFVVYHKRDESFRSFSFKFYSWGRSRMRAMLTDSRLIDSRVLILLLFWFTVLVSTLITYYYLALALLVYVGLLMLHGVVYSARKRKPEFLLLVPSLYLTQHVSYFLGLLSGLLAGGYKPPDKPERFTVIQEQH
jgi:GT2 family glycosyltransferase